MESKDLAPSLPAESSAALTPTEAWILETLATYTSWREGGEDSKGDDRLRGSEATGVRLNLDDAREVYLTKMVIRSKAADGIAYPSFQDTRLGEVRLDGHAVGTDKTGPERLDVYVSPDKSCRPRLVVQGVDPKYESAVDRFYPELFVLPGPSPTKDS